MKLPLPGRSLFLVSLIWLGVQIQANASCEPIQLPLKRGSFKLLHFTFKPHDSATAPKALVIFGSGGGGWSAWEDRTGDKLQADGYEMLGLDTMVYAHDDYTLNTLEEDFQKIAQFGLAPYGDHPPPLIIGGWSTGAEQAVAIAGGPHPPTGLVGLLLVSPGSTGGYGPYATNYIDINSPPDKIFSLADFAPRLTHLRIAQWHADLDVLDSRAWLSSLKAPHREFDFSIAMHDYRGACDEFLAELSKSLAWILTLEPETPPTADGAPPPPTTNQSTPSAPHRITTGL